MPDDWDDEFGDDWDLDGDELFLDDELDSHDDWEVEPDPGHAVGFGTDDPAEEEGWGLAAAGAGELGVHEGVGMWSDEPAATGGGGVPAGQGAAAGSGERMSWDAWDVGVAFGLGGWMLDRHAEQVGEQVRAALAEAGTHVRAGDALRSAPHPPPPTGLRYQAGAGTLATGDRLDPGRVYAELLAATSHARGLLLQAEGHTPAVGRAVVIISAVPGSAGPGLWVVAEQHPYGFAASRLVPVFQADASGGFAVFATDVVLEATEAVVWACRREGIEPTDLTVTRRSV